MEITKEQIKIFRGKKCPYCKNGVKMVTETEIYGREYSGRKVVVCVNYPKCDAYVGCHDDGKPLGRLANKELRKAKIEAHEKFDWLWKNNYILRSEAYKYLSEYLNIPPEFTHIGMFSVKTCKAVKEWAEDKIKNINLP